MPPLARFGAGGPAVDTRWRWETTVTATFAGMAILGFCAVPPGSRTPRRYHCQPDLVVRALGLNPPAAEVALAQARMVPLFTNRRYGQAGYAQLALDNAPELLRGADDESELGAFHDLFQPQRAANLRARLDEFTPAGMEAGILFAN